jgi:hypothetical protein
MTASFRSAVSVAVTSRVLGLLLVVLILSLQLGEHAT